MKIADISEVLLHLGLSGTVTETERAIVLECIRSAEGAVQRFLQYDPKTGTRTEYYPQLDLTHESSREPIWEISSTDAYMRDLASAASDQLQVRHVPIRSITTLHIDYDGRFGTRSGAFGASTLKTEGVDYWPQYDGVDSSSVKICRDGIIRSLGLWPNSPGSVKIVYVSGYTDTELHGQDTVIDASPILEAVIDEAVRRVNKVYSRMKHRLSGFSGPKTSETLGDYSYSSASGIYDKLVGTMNDILLETQYKLHDFARYDLGVL